MRTCEFVTLKHPDKVCDRIADSLLDAFLTLDSKARVAIEVMGGHGKVRISGEVTAPPVDIESVVRPIVGEGILVDAMISGQSPFIASGVDSGGAGDQGIMVGYACRETETLMPYDYELARSLCRKIYERHPADGKVQVTLDDDFRVASVVASFQNSKTPELEELVRSLVKADTYHINRAGEWILGGFDADSGLSGRKIVVDSYGPSVPVGGGSFSGKDATKVDRSGAYMARKIAVDLLGKDSRIASATVRLAYVIGEPLPVMAEAELKTDKGERMTVTNLQERYDLSPAGIRRALRLDKVKFSETSDWGHFGRGFAWDN